MKLWTIQGDNVLKELLNNKVYKPDIALSDGIISENTIGVYGEMCNQYMKRNKIKCKGLVFCTSRLDDQPILSYEQFYSYFREHPSFVSSLCPYGKNKTLIELDIPDKYDTIPIKFQDYNILCARYLENNCFREFYKDELKNIPFQAFENDLEISQKLGWLKNSDNREKWDQIVQEHIHKLKLDYIVNLYPTIEMPTVDSFYLPKECEESSFAIKLKEKLKLI